MLRASAERGVRPQRFAGELHDKGVLRQEPAPRTAKALGVKWSASLPRQTQAFSSSRRKDPNRIDIRPAHSLREISEKC
jgi:hypothetical protein